jgi:molybdenum cofactor biosynthesis enzyme MoaA
MPLIPCPECGASISSTAQTCPQCGAEQLGSIRIFRKPSFTGSIYKVRVEVDGNLIGNLAHNESVELVLSAGDHTLHVRGGGLSNTVIIRVRANEELKLATHFSNWGILGGGLRVDIV